MSDDPSAAGAQPALVKQVRASLRRYAFIFTCIGALFTAANVVHQMYIRSLERATLISRDGALIARQMYLAKSSKGGKEYSRSSMLDEEFKVSLIVLMNYYESTAEMVDNWVLSGPVVRAQLACPLGKHVRIFVLGESREGYWATDGSFFLPGQFPATMKMYAEIKDTASACESSWRGPRT